MPVPTATPHQGITDFEYLDIKKTILRLVNKQLRQNGHHGGDPDQYLRQMIASAYHQAKASLTKTQGEKLFSEVFLEVREFAPIQPFLDDPSVTEVMVNSASKIYVERDGRLIKTDAKFKDEEHVRRLIDLIIEPLGRRISADAPTVDARLHDGSRVNAVIPPVAIDGSSITIRKFNKEKLGVSDLVGYDSLTDHMAEFLKACVLAKINIVISGGTGSGKTTLLNILSSFVPENERIVTIEDAAELQLQQDHIVRMETKPADISGEGEVDIRQLVRNSLRMRPDRIVVGEVRGGEALDMLQAMNTGHDGSLTTLHANSPRDALSRLETMVLMSDVEMPLRVVREQITSAIDLIVQQSRMRDGSRKVTRITEVSGMEGATIVLADLFKFTQEESGVADVVIGEFEATGMRPNFKHKLDAAGVKLGNEVYAPTFTSEAEKDRRRRRRGR